MTYIDYYENNLRKGTVQQYYNKNMFEGISIVCFSQLMYPKESRTTIGHAEEYKEQND